MLAFLNNYLFEVFRYDLTYNVMTSDDVTYIYPTLAHLLLIDLLSSVGNFVANNRTDVLDHHASLLHTNHTVLN